VSFVMDESIRSPKVTQGRSLRQPFKIKLKWLKNDRLYRYHIHHNEVILLFSHPEVMSSARARNGSSSSRVPFESFTQ
jgi:hypothetical protein